MADSSRARPIPSIDLDVDQLQEFREQFRPVRE